MKKRIEMKESNQGHTKRNIPVFLMGMITLGVFCILLGIGLVVASEWQHIPSSVKLSGCLLALLASLMITIHFKQRQNASAQEISAFTTFFLIGGNIFAIKNLYDLNVINIYNGSFIWALLGTFLLFFTKRSIIPLMCLGLYTIGLWDIIITLKLPYVLVAGIFFVVFLIGHIFSGSTSVSKALRIFGFFGIFVTLACGDLGLTRYHHTNLFAFLVSSAFLVYLQILRAKDDQTSFFNCLMLFVAFRCVNLLWVSYLSLLSLGLIFIGFGSVILGLATLIYYQSDTFCKMFGLNNTSWEDVKKSFCLKSLIGNTDKNNN